MNYRLIFNLVGKVLVIEAVLLLFPFLVSIIYLEKMGMLAFGVTVAIAAAIGLPFVFFIKPKQQSMYAKEGLIITAFAWIAVSLVGTLPFVISREIPSFVNALFEIVSGFTTTGASVLDDVESLSHGILFWRSFSHWIGGMGVLVFVLAVVNRNDRSIHILRAEMPGPTVDKLVPKAKTTAFILYAIYIGLTFILAMMLWCGDMNLFESVVHALGTAGTGGFGIKGDSLGGYSQYSQWVITVFMVLFGINFNLFYLILVGKITTFLKSRELWTYLSIVVVSTIIITINIYGTYKNVSDALRHAAFQVGSVISTTGYSTVDFNAWPALSKAILFILMFIGGCAGSTAGGFKLTRIIILCKKTGNDLKKVLHPRTATVVKMEGKMLSEETISGVTSYLVIYVFILMAVFLVLSLDPNIGAAGSIETNFTAAVACFNNIGPGFGQVGAASNYNLYSPVSKIVLTFAMLLGRLEIYPILLTFSISTWIRK